MHAFNLDICFVLYYVFKKHKMAKDNFLRGGYFITDDTNIKDVFIPEQFTEIQANADH